MRIEQIELKNTGPFTQPIGIGPLADGLNILAANNEVGKTSLLLGAARALFDRHNVSGDTIKQLQPVGTNLAPDISVVFWTNEGRFKIHKHFLQSPTSNLYEERDGKWHLIADGDAADNGVLELIGGVRPVRGVSKAEHWGLMRYLWARQGEISEWLDWNDNFGTRIRTGLARVDIDPVLDRLYTQFQKAQNEHFTSTGRVAKNSPLWVEQEKVERIETEITAVRADLAKTDEDLEELHVLQDTFGVREREKQAADKEVDDLTRKLKEVDLLKKDLERYQDSFKAAKERLNEIHKDKETLGDIEKKLQSASGELDKKQDEERRARQEEEKVQIEHGDLQKNVNDLQKTIDLERKRENRLREIQELLVLGEELEKKRERLRNVQQRHRALRDLRHSKAALPNVKKLQVTHLEKTERESRELAVRAESAGMRIALKPEKATTVSISREEGGETKELAKGIGTTISAVQNVRLYLQEWGELTIESGSEEATELEKKINESCSRLDKGLKRLGVGSVREARECAEKIKDLDRDIKSVESSLEELLEDEDSVEAFEGEIEKLESDAKHRWERIDMSEDESGLSQVELKAQLSKIQTSISSNESQRNEFLESVDKLRLQIDNLTLLREEATKGANTTINDITSLESQKSTIENRYADGIQKAEENTQEVFVSAKAELEVARKKLPYDWEKLESRHEHALESLRQITRDFHVIERKILSLETLLENSGLQGLYSRETELVESLSQTKKEEERLRKNALAARLLAGLIDHRKKAAVRTVLKPLEDQLSAVFADITGIQNRQVFFDENLQVVGIGRKRDEAISFSQLSQGAKEQLLLALRAAVAIELAKDGPQILILDDVLVNTDSVRQKNVLDFIQRVSEQVQVLIVTCHTERYQGVGTNIEISYEIK